MSTANIDLPLRDNLRCQFISIHANRVQEMLLHHPLYLEVSESCIERPREGLELLELSDDRSIKTVMDVWNDLLMRGYTVK